MKLLASDAIAKIHPHQSLDFIFTGYQYSVLRLGETNFRLGLYAELGTYGGLNFEVVLRQAKTGLQVEVSQCNEVKGKDATTCHGALRLSAYYAKALP